MNKPQAQAAPKKITRYILDPQIRERLLSRQQYIGHLADLSISKGGKPLKFAAVKKRLDENASILTSIEQMAAIREVLGIPDSKVLYVAVKS